MRQYSTTPDCPYSSPGGTPFRAWCTSRVCGTDRSSMTACPPTSESAATTSHRSAHLFCRWQATRSHRTRVRECPPAGATGADANRLCNTAQTAVSAVHRESFGYPVSPACAPSSHFVSRSRPTRPWRWHRCETAWHRDPGSGKTALPQPQSETNAVCARTAR